MYEMLSGLPPFYSQDVNQMYTNIISASVQFPEYFSADAKTLLRQVFLIEFSFLLFHLSNLSVIFQFPEP